MRLLTGMIVAAMLVPAVTAGYCAEDTGMDSVQGVFDVTDFKAAADGSSDATAAIQAAMDAAAKVGGKVYLPWNCTFSILPISVQPST